MPRKNNKLLRYVLKNRYIPSKNRRRVGQSLLIVSIFVFFIFLINFAIIIGTDSKFGVDLSEGAQAVHQFMIAQGFQLQKTQQPIRFMRLLTKNMFLS